MRITSKTTKPYDLVKGFTVKHTEKMLRQLNDTKQSESEYKNNNFTVI